MRCATGAARGPRRPTASALPELAVVALVLLGGVSAWQHAVGHDGVRLDATGVASATHLQIADLDTMRVGSDCADAGPYVTGPIAPPLVMDDARPGSTLTRFVCVRNAGTNPVDLRTAIVDARSTETGCTGDEPEHDPDGAGCGAVGELATDLAVEVGASAGTTCAGAAAHPVRFAGVADTALRSLGSTLAAGAHACYRVDAAYLAFTPGDEVQANQTDRVTWRFRFSAEPAEVDDAGVDRPPDTAYPSPGRLLARTGTEVLPLAVTAMSLILAGGALIIACRRVVGRARGGAPPPVSPRLCHGGTTGRDDRPEGGGPPPDRPT